MAVLNLTWFRAHPPPSRGREDKLWALPPEERNILKMFLTSILKRHIIKAY
jgi:hypothetical protein